jgi:hypothetical protein
VSVPLVIHNAKLIRRITLTSVAYPALPYFSTLSHKRHDFLENVTEHKICVLIFSTFSWKISRFKNNWAILSYMYIRLQVSYPLFLPHFNENRIFSPDFRKILKYQISWKSVQYEQSCSMRAGRLILAFRNFTSTPKNVSALSDIAKITYGICVCSEFTCTFSHLIFVQFVTAGMTH